MPFCLLISSIKGRNENSVTLTNPDLIDENIMNDLIIELEELVGSLRKLAKNLKFSSYEEMITTEFFSKKK